jgi:hypothetical protein
LADEGLRQHEIGHVGFADLGEDLVVAHDSAPELGAIRLNHHGANSGRGG